MHVHVHVHMSSHTFFKESGFSFFDMFKIILISQLIRAINVLCAILVLLNEILRYTVCNVTEWRLKLLSCNYEVV
jgi:hypothetical protein